MNTCTYMCACGTHMVCVAFVQYKLQWMKFTCVALHVTYYTYMVLGQRSGFDGLFPLSIYFSIS